MKTLYWKVLYRCLGTYLEKKFEQQMQHALTKTTDNTAIDQTFI